jgi:tRNA U38,U39,U40 pseudouridine synthase TruA
MNFYFSPMEGLTGYIYRILLEVGKNKMEATDVQKILNGKKRTEAVPIAQPKGLCLRDVQYNQ